MGLWANACHIPLSRAVEQVRRRKSLFSWGVPRETKPPKHRPGLLLDYRYSPEVGAKLPDVELEFELFPPKTGKAHFEFPHGRTLPLTVCALHRRPLTRKRSLHGRPPIYRRKIQD